MFMYILKQNCGILIPKATCLSLASWACAQETRGSETHELIGWVLTKGTDNQMNHFEILFYSKA